MGVARSKRLQKKHKHESQRMMQIDTTESTRRAMLVDLERAKKKNLTFSEKEAERYKEYDIIIPSDMIDREKKKPNRGKIQVKKPKKKPPSKETPPEDQKSVENYLPIKKVVDGEEQVVNIPYRTGRKIVDPQRNLAQCRICERFGKDAPDAPYLLPGDDSKKGFRLPCYPCEWTKAQRRWDDELLVKLSARIPPELKEYVWEVVKKVPRGAHIVHYMVWLITKQMKEMTMDEAVKELEAFIQSQWLDKRTSEIQSEIYEDEEDDTTRLELLDQLSLLKIIAGHAIDPKTEVEWHPRDGVTFEISRKLTRFAYEACEASGMAMDDKRRDSIRQHLSRMRKAKVIENSPDGSQAISIRSFKKLGASKAEIKKFRRSKNKKVRVKK